jgi:hypothetical protein
MRMWAVYDNAPPPAPSSFRFAAIPAFTVIPAKAGIQQQSPIVVQCHGLDSRFRGNDKETWDDTPDAAMTFPSS